MAGHGQFAGSRQAVHPLFRSPDERSQINGEEVVSQGPIQFYSEVQKMGGKRWDTSSLIALQER
jgi:hypothetical protein